MLVPPLDSFNPPIGPLILNEPFLDELQTGILKLFTAEAHYLHDAPVCIEAPALSVAHYHQKQIQRHRFMTEPLQIAPMQKVMINDGITFCPSHAFIVGAEVRKSHLDLYLASPLQQRRTRIHTALQAVSRLVSRL